MWLAIIIAQAITLAVVLFLLLRKPVAADGARDTDLAAAIARLEVLSQASDRNVRDSIAEVRSEADSNARQTREANNRAASELRQEVTASVALLGKTLSDGLANFRADNASSAEALRSAVQAQMDSIAKRLTAFTSDATAQQITLREALNKKLTDLGAANEQQQERIRGVVGEGLSKLNVDNAKKLEEMRVTVDEKLHATLQTRLTESFGLVTEQLGKVHTGLGEMKELATGVGDLKKVLSNVRSRGVVGEFLLGQQIEQMFSPEQYLKNARIKPGTQETVEYALKFPNGDGEPVLLAIDSKFPREDWERLEAAYDNGSADDIAKAGAAFERAIRTEGKRICEKYIDEPVTLPHAIMFLPTENLYAEVVRRPGLQSEIQGRCRVTIAGPSTFMAILTSFQMGFHTMAIQRKGDEVWRVLSAAKNEFDKFGGLMEKVEKQVGTVQNTLRDIGSKTKTINRTLRNVSLNASALETEENAAPAAMFEEVTVAAPLLSVAASGDFDAD